MRLKFPTLKYYEFLYLFFSLVFVFWAISFFEFVKTGFPQNNISEILSTVLVRLSNDFFTCLAIGVFSFPIFLILSLFNGKVAKTSLYLIFLTVILINISLVKYSLTTLLNLGADLLGYSFDDIQTTIKSSEKFSISYFIPYLLFLGILFLLNYLFKKLISKRLIPFLTLLFFIFFGIMRMISESSNFLKDNKIAFLISDIVTYKNEKDQLSSYIKSDTNHYPLIKQFQETDDVLSPFFNLKTQKPNIVIIIVEGLGSEFVNGNSKSGFTPFLDSLVDKSLFWNNFISNTGRTFGVLPSLLASLPYGEKGFLELEKIPSHLSLIGLLKAEGYTTSFITGDKSEFDNKINFLEYNQIDHIIDEHNFGTDYVKTDNDKNGFSWGYPDDQIFKRELHSFPEKKQPRFDVIMTLSNHEPFEFPNKSFYFQKVDSITNSKERLQLLKEEIEKYKDIYAALMYSDASLNEFFTEYSKLPEFENTIFLITGDHRLIPIPQKNKLSRFHVPFYIYSPLLKENKQFNSISSHWDVAPSLYSFLVKNYQMNYPDKVAWMGKGIDTSSEFRNHKIIPLMRYKGKLNDMLFKNYFYSDGELFEIDKNLNRVKIDSAVVLNTVLDSLNSFKKINYYTTQNDKIFPELLNIYIDKRIEFTDDELAIINKNIKGLTNDKAFIIARDLAFKKEYDKAILICNYILNKQPNYADARILKGRVLGWKGDYVNAEIELMNVLKRYPFYDDTYLAILDVYWWSNQDSKSMDIYKKSIYNKISNPDIDFKLARAFTRLNKMDEASKILDSLTNLFPNNEMYRNFNNNLN